MTEQIFCPAQTYRGSRLEPAEFCETEVEEYGDLCSKHEEDDRADEAYDRERDARYDD